MLNDLNSDTRINGVNLLSVIGLFLFFWSFQVVGAPVTLVDGATQGFYNDSIGTVLDNTSAVFPGPNVSTGDPILDVISAPDLSAASGALGDWLTDPLNLAAPWSGPQAIPTTWNINHETAIIYEIDAGSGGLQNVNLSFGVDNGIFVWLDGVFIGGALRPGGSSLGEHVFTLASITPGIHHVQILREDHGGATGYAVEVTGEVIDNNTPPAPSSVPEPATYALFCLGIAVLGINYSRKMSNSKELT